MKDEDFNTDDIPEVDFSDATFYYAVKIPKQKICTTIANDNLEWLKKGGKGYLQRLDFVIRWARANGCPIDRLSTGT